MSRIGEYTCTVAALQVRILTCRFRYPPNRLWLINKKHLDVDPVYEAHSLRFQPGGSLDAYAAKRWLIRYCRGSENKPESSFTTFRTWGIAIRRIT